MDQEVSVFPPKSAGTRPLDNSSERMSSRCLGDSRCRSPRVPTQPRRGFCCPAGAACRNLQTPGGGWGFICRRSARLGEGCLVLCATKLLHDFDVCSLFLGKWTLGCW